MLLSAILQLQGHLRHKRRRRYSLYPVRPIVRKQCKHAVINLNRILEGRDMEERIGGDTQEIWKRY